MRGSGLALCAGVRLPAGKRLQPTADPHLSCRAVDDDALYRVTAELVRAAREPVEEALRKGDFTRMMVLPMWFVDGEAAGPVLTVVLLVLGVGFIFADPKVRRKFTSSQGKGQDVRPTGDEPGDPGRRGPAWLPVVLFVVLVVVGVLAGLYFGSR